MRLTTLAGIWMCAASFWLSGCGIIALPVTIPEVMKNARTLKFSVDVVDENGTPLDAVTVMPVRHAKRIDLLFEYIEEKKPCATQRADGAFSYRGFGDFGILVTYFKEGYRAEKVGYALDDDTTFEGTMFLFFLRMAERTDQYVNVRKEPRSMVVLKREVRADTDPAIKKEPEALGPPVPDTRKD